MASAKKKKSVSAGADKASNDKGGANRRKFDRREKAAQRPRSGELVKTAIDHGNRK